MLSPEARYALATLRTLGSTAAYEGSDFGLLIEEAVQKLEAVDDKPREVIEMYICEIQHLHLKADQLYRFIVQKDCDNCKVAAIVADPSNKKYV
jgi:hypothetical protein